MSLKIRADPIDRDIELLLEESLSPKARSQQFAEFASEQIEEAKKTNSVILGRVPRYTVSVDGKKGAPLTSVKPEGYVIAEFELVEEALIWVADQLDMHSPFKTGRYKKHNVFFADGVEFDIRGVIPRASEYVVINTTDYARKIETGSSSQAPDGVYHAVAMLSGANNKFGNIAQIKYDPFRALVSGRAGNKSGNRNPAIIIKIRK